jgi:hypothetical protein
MTQCSRVARWFIFKPKFPIGLNFGGPLLVYFMTIWKILCPFGIIYGRLIVCGPLVYFPQFGMFGQRKIWQPCNALDCQDHFNGNETFFRGKLSLPELALLLS